MSRYYRVCPFCGAHLDPGERCDCQEKEEDRSGAANAGTVQENTTAYTTRKPVSSSIGPGLLEIKRRFYV